MNYILYQVVHTREHGWMGLEERREVLGIESIDLDLYSITYEGVSNPEAEPFRVLEQLFKI